MTLELEDWSISKKKFWKKVGQYYGGNWCALKENIGLLNMEEYSRWELAREVLLEKWIFRELAVVAVPLEIIVFVEGTVLDLWFAMIAKP